MIPASKFAPFTNYQPMPKDLDSIVALIEKMAQNIARLDAKQALAEPVTAMKARVFGLALGQDGKEIGQYSRFTKAKKKAKGQKSTKVTLVDSGRLKNSIKIEKTANGARVIGTTYAGKLQVKYNYPMALNKAELNQYLANIAKQMSR